MKYLSILVLLFSGAVNSQPADECVGSPEKAVLKLPSPLDDWGSLVCTPYGHIITNIDGYVWAKPGPVNSVNIHSQLVYKPEKIGNESFFTKIDMAILESGKAEKALKVFNERFKNPKKIPTIYKLEIRTSNNKTATFVFFDYQDFQYGMLCNGECDISSVFMLINLKKNNKS